MTVPSVRVPGHQRHMASARWGPSLPEAVLEQVLVERAGFLDTVEAILRAGGWEATHRMDWSWDQDWRHRRHPFEAVAMVAENQATGLVALMSFHGYAERRRSSSVGDLVAWKSLVAGERLPVLASGRVTLAPSTREVMMRYAATVGVGTVLEDALMATLGHEVLSARERDGLPVLGALGSEPEGRLGFAIHYGGEWLAAEEHVRTAMLLVRDHDFAEGQISRATGWPGDHVTRMRAAAWRPLPGHRWIRGPQARLP